METIVSIKEMAEVTAAKNTSIKNTVPTNPPIGILANTLGSVMNISPGPALRLSLIHICPHGRFLLR